jgi:DNA segregation ATPase FtsK/SpoIIIE-like protein
MTSAVEKAANDPAVLEAMDRPASTVRNGETTSITLSTNGMDPVVIDKAAAERIHAAANVMGGDELLEDAIRLVFEYGKASTSLLQRRLRIGYGRASGLIDAMEQRGFVGPGDGSKPRELLKKDPE